MKEPPQALWKFLDEEAYKYTLYRYSGNNTFKVSNRLSSLIKKCKMIVGQKFIIYGSNVLNNVA